MFYCETCGTDREWPTDRFMPMSTGRCEICNKHAACFDVPSKVLPRPAPKALDSLSPLAREMSAEARARAKEANPDPAPMPVLAVITDRMVVIDRERTAWQFVAEDGLWYAATNEVPMSRETRELRLHFGPLTEMDVKRVAKS